MHDMIGIGRVNQALVAAALTIAAAVPGLAHSDPATTAPIGPCGFSIADLSFRGTPEEQAACLLRRVKPKGVIDARPTRLPKVLRERIGKAMQLDAGAIAREFQASEAARWSRACPGRCPGRGTMKPARLSCAIS